MEAESLDTCIQELSQEPVLWENLNTCDLTAGERRLSTSLTVTVHSLLAAAFSLVSKATPDSGSVYMMNLTDQSLDLRETEFKNLNQ